MKSEDQQSLELVHISFFNSFGFIDFVLVLFPLWLFLTYIFLAKYWYYSTYMQFLKIEFAVNSVIKISAKMWELWVHPDYDHLYIPLTSK